MALTKKEDTLSLTVKISRELHDEVDKIRGMAKKANAVYDPTPAIEKALRKDIAATKKELEEIQKEASKK
jgi:predicted  nucleic acid-binding Zn-ribbon protein